MQGRARKGNDETKEQRKRKERGKKEGKRKGEKEKERKRKEREKKEKEKNEEAASLIQGLSVVRDLSTNLNKWVLLRYR